MTDLLVPLRVNALALTRRERVTGPRQDYEALPWFDGTRDHNANTPPLAAAIEAEPFAEHGTWLEPGTHLHWSLPDGLTRGSTGPRPENTVLVDDVWMPPAPNRWMVKRMDEQGRSERVWLVESDFVHRGKHRPDPYAIAYPRHVQRAGDPPFLFLGRQLELNPDTFQVIGHFDFGSSETRLHHYGPALTALGAGDPMFAAHYPSCRSVFGLYDDTPPMQEQSYRIYGWYADKSTDPLYRVRQHLRDNPDVVRHHLSALANADDSEIVQPEHGAPITDIQFMMAYDEKVKQRFGWSVAYNAPGTEPGGILCVGNARAAPGSRPERAEDTRLDLDEIAIGASPSEAFAAFALRDAEVSAGEMDRVINLLDGTDLTAHTADLAAKLEEARHSGQFVSLRGHVDWAIRPAESAGHPGMGGLHLPDEIAEALNDLNAAQRRYDTAQRDMDGLRQGLFDDWSACLTAMMPEDDTHGFGPEADGLRKLMERDRLVPLEELLERTGHLYFGRDGAGHDQVVDAATLALHGPDRAQGLAGRQTGIRHRDVLEDSDAIHFLRVHSDAVVGDIIPEGESPPFGARPSEIHPRPRVSDSRMPLDFITLLPGEEIAAVSGMVSARPKPDPEGPKETREEALGDIAAMLDAPHGDICAMIGVPPGDIEAPAAPEGLRRLEIRTTFGRVFGPFGIGEVPEGYTAFEQTVPRGMTCRGLETFVQGMVRGLALIVAPRLTHESQSAHHATLAHDVVLAYGHLHELLEESRGEGARLALALIPGPRFFAPHDPVVVMDGAHVRASPRHGQTGLLDCRCTDVVESWTPRHFLAFANNARAPDGLIDGRVETLDGNALATPDTPEMWHPIELEWQAEMLAQAEGSNLADHEYDPEFVLRHNAIPDDHMDLVPLDSGETLNRTYEYVSGRAILNGSGARQLANKWNTDLRKAADMLPANLQGAVSTDQDAPMVLPLGGFHDRLVMRHHLPQRLVSDPTALPFGAALARRVSAALGSYHPTAPLFDGAFHPLRSGELTLQNLRVIDSFGRTREGRPRITHKAPRLRPASGEQDRIRLPMRLSQPARLDFRWLSARHGQAESGLHPAATPVVGWVLADDLDGAVALYAGDGRFLGEVTSDATWTPAPGDPRAPRSLREVEDPLLRRLIAWLTRAGEASLVAAFLGALDAALIQIDPAEAAAHQSRALLVSRPVALLRARLGLEMQHGLTEDRSARAFKARLAGHPPDDHGMGQVQIPVRLGEHGHFSDGLCGYWLGGDAHAPLGTLHTAPGLNHEIAHEAIRTSSSADLRDLPLRLTPDGPAEEVILLMDPHGSVHATTGILPVKSVSLPPEFYRDQIASLRITFPVGPVLTPPDRMTIPLPAEPGFSWSWLERTRTGGWNEVAHHPTLARADLERAVGPQAGALWLRLIAVGQLVPVDAAPVDADGIPLLGHVMPASGDAEPTRFDDLGLSVIDVSRHLHALAAAIEPMDETARFDQGTKAASGWLQLRPTPRPAAGAAEEATVPFRSAGGL